jgi:hypothetical protein
VRRRTLQQALECLRLVLLGELAEVWAVLAHVTDIERSLCTLGFVCESLAADETLLLVLYHLESLRVERALELGEVDTYHQVQSPMCDAHASSILFHVSSAPEKLCGVADMTGVVEEVQVKDRGK